ncbi:MAG TPA: hypothetical protein VHM90_05840, partial [Phycisphaerae bacterium]|nr:hypothetical protein [Phycisphaerae bacterium]
ENSFASWLVELKEYVEVFSADSESENRDLLDGETLEQEASDSWAILDGDEVWIEAHDVSGMLPAGGSEF